MLVLGISWYQSCDHDPLTLGDLSLDMAGCVTNASYFILLFQLFPLLKKFGATGLLIEYEDMFPYSGELEELAQTYAYRFEMFTGSTQNDTDYRFEMLTGSTRKDGDYMWKCLFPFASCYYLYKRSHWQSV